MNRKELIEQIKQKQSYLCVGLDTDIEKIPAHLRKEKDPVFEFNRQIIDATEPYAVCYKPNIAFYESQGLRGWESLQRTIEYLPSHVFSIADAKRGDIGNTAGHYAKTFFETYPFDAITLSPYMGKDTIEPFLKYKDKWSIILALTSNPGAENFEMLDSGGFKLYEEVLMQSSQWGSIENTMYVVGATRPEAITGIRKLVPEHFLLVPGVGAQGGDLAQLSKAGLNKDCGLLVNASRSIIFADSSENFAKTAAIEAKKVQQDMAALLNQI